MTIVEKKEKGRSVLFELTEVTSGRKTVWTPPPNLDQAEWLKALWFVIQRFEANGQPAPQGAMMDLAAVPPDITLRDFCSHVFMPRKAITMAENTRASWQTCINLRIAPMLGDLPVAQITDLHLSDFLQKVQFEGLSKATVDKYYLVLQSIFKMAEKTLKISNPMLLVSKVKARKDEAITKVDAHTADEIASIEKALEREPLKWQVMFRLLCDTGLRRGEACAIKWDHIDFTKSTIRIDASLGYTPAKGVYETTTKNRKHRTVSIGNDVAMLLLQLYRENIRSRCNSPYVFHQNKSTEPINPTSATSWFRKFAAKLGFSSHPHKLRHSFASICITNGADPASVAACLGHSNADITLRIYTSANETSMRQASEIGRVAVLNAMPASQNAMESMMLH